MTWMTGVRVEGRPIPPTPEYRDAHATGRLRIEIRNPPVLSAIGAGLGLLMLGGASLAVLVTDLAETATSIRLIAPLLLGLIVTTGVLSAFRPHTVLALAGDRLRVARHRGPVPATLPVLSRIERAEADPLTGDVRLIGPDGTITLLREILPEQATEVAAAISSAVGSAPRDRQDRPRDERS